MRSQGGQDVICEVVYRLLLDVVLDLEEVVGGFVARVDGRVPDVFGGLDCGCGIVDISSGIQVKIWRKF